MQRFSSLGILCFLCISHLLILLAISDAATTDNELVADVCNATISMINCTDPNINSSSSPVFSEGPCAVSESFLKSHCSPEYHLAYWDAFKNALGSDNLKYVPVMAGLYHRGYSIYINLSWNMSYVDIATPCGMPLAADDVDFIIPDVIDLTTFANGAFQFSPENLYLLFNCKNLDALPTLRNLEKESKACQDYKKFQQLCPNKNNSLEITSCAQLMPIQELTLHKVFETLSCTHFHSLVNNTSLILNDSFFGWSTGMVQLLYGDIACEACINGSGQCIFNETAHRFEHCEHQNSGCNAFSCTEVKIVTGVTTTVAAIVSCMMLFFWINYRRKFRYSCTKHLLSSSSNRLVTQRASMLSKKFGPVDTREFSFETLSKAAKSFADENMIGDGGFGAVYLGVLGDGCKVAIKKLYHDSFRRMDHFYNEIKILSSIDHPNLVKLYGFCCEDSRDLLLVFEYASNGTVFDQLHDDTKPAMPWKTRLNIARETAEALTYLHSSKTPPIYHRDVKTANILLDDDLGVKLADFGLSRLVPLEATHVSTAPQGTPGYLDPEYHQCYQLTDKSDVYSFGVVLVELVSAKLAVDMSRDRSEINLSSLALMKIGCGAWENLVDPRLEMEGNPDVEMTVKRVLEIAFMCLNAEKGNRPTMKCVAEALASMCNEYGHSSGSQYDAFSFKMDMSSLSPVQVLPVTGSYAPSSV